MFIQFYNDLRVEDHIEAKRFYQAVFNFSLLTGIAVFVIVIVFMDPLIKIFVSGFDTERIRALNPF